MYNQRTPAKWTEGEHFSVSENGAIKPSGPAYDGKACFLTLDAARHILNNIDSFRESVKLADKRVLNKLIDKDLIKMRSTFIKNGLTPDQAEAAVQAVLANKEKVG